MKRIYLNLGKFTLVDDDKFEWLNQWKWYAQVSSYNDNYFYSYRIEYKNGKRITIYMHREIMSVPKGLFIDHINHDTLDNRQENLRICTQSENMKNRKSFYNNILGLKCINKSSPNRYRVRISIDRKRVVDKCFESLKDAIKERDLLLKKYHGEFFNVG